MIARLRNLLRREREWYAARDQLNDLLTFDENHPRDPVSGRFIDAPNQLLDVVAVVCAHVPDHSIPCGPPDR